MNNDFNNQNDNEYVYKTVMEGKQKNRVWSVSSLVIGILSVLCCCFDWPGLIFGVLAIVFSIISRKNLGYFDGLAIAGLILGIFGLVFSAFSIIGGYVLESSGYYEELMKELENMYGEDFGDMNSF